MNKKMQEAITPEIKNCSCGATANDEQWSEGHSLIYRVYCEKGHTLTKYCGSRHRAICLWNNRVTEHSGDFTEQDKRKREHNLAAYRSRKVRRITQLIKEIDLIKTACLCYLHDTSIINNLDLARAGLVDSIDTKEK